MAPVALGVSVSSITRSSATITWTTDVPATSQVEFGTTTLDALRSRVDASLVANHRQVLTGLSPGATYRFRVRSVAATGALGISADAVFVTAPAGSGPEIGAISARQVTSSTIALDWSTSTGNVAQVEYGQTPNYASFTLLQVFSVPAQEMVMTNLRPATDYHFRVKAWDASGALGSSDDFVFTTASAGPATLLGSQVVQPERLSLLGGQAAAYQYVATQSGQASLVRLYLEPGTSAPLVRVGLYSDSAGTPGSILSQGSAPALGGGWVNVSMPPVSMLQNTRYWVSVLSPIGGGTLMLRDAGNGGSSVLSQQTTLAAFPSAFGVGLQSARSPLSLTVQQVPPSVTLTGPVDGAVVTGSVTLSAVVDDDVPVARFQFLVDGQPVGPALSAAPYSATWDSTRANARQPHTISARATDSLGRSSVSSTLGVQVDNGPQISGVSVSGGLTASSFRVAWSTDILADSQVEYGPTPGYGVTTPLDARFDWRHEAQLTGLLPGTTYHYRVKSRDANGALATSADQTFATAEP